MRQPIEEVGGRFVALARDPITQMHSIMNVKLEPYLSLGRLDGHYPSDNTYWDVAADNLPLAFRLANKFRSDWRSRNLRLNIQHAVDRLRIAIDERRQRKKPGEKILNDWRSRDPVAVQTAIISLFEYAASAVLGEMGSFVATMDDKSILSMERYTTEEEYFAQCFEIITGRDMMPGHWDTIKMSDHVHQHTDKKRSAHEIWNLWSKPMQDEFVRFLGQPAGIARVLQRERILVTGLMERERYGGSTRFVVRKHCAHPKA